MCSLRMRSCLMLGAALLAACSERSTTTAPWAPAVVVATAGTTGDRPYAWSLTCQANTYGGISATWSWTAGGVAIAGSGGSAACYSYSNNVTVGGTGMRPRNADGLFAWVGSDQQRWTFDPARPFSAQLKGTLYLCLMYDAHCQNKKVTGTLKIDS